jgi:hypothetical protein
MENYPRPAFTNLSRSVLMELLDDLTVTFQDFSEHEKQHEFTSGTARQTWNLLLKSDRLHEDTGLFKPEGISGSPEERQLRVFNLAQCVVAAYVEHEKAPQFAPAVSFGRNIGRKRFEFIVSFTEEQVNQAEVQQTLPFDTPE